MRLLGPSILALATALDAGAQVPSRWVTRLGGDGSDAATDVAATLDGGLFVCGRTTSFGVGQVDCWVARLDAGGLVLWERSIGGPGLDEAWAVIETADAGCLLVGTTASFGAGGSDGWIVKLDAGGSLDWQKTYGDGDDQELSAVALSPDGYYVGGTRTNTATQGDVWILELDPAGNVLWQETFGGKADDRLAALAATSLGLIVSVHAQSRLASPNPVAFLRPWLIELDGDGGSLWQKTYDVSSGDAWNDIAVLDDGFVVAGEVLSMAFFRGDAWIVRLNRQGEVVWDRRYGDHFANWFDGAAAVRLTRDGGFGVLGSTGTAGAGSDDWWFLKLDADGLIEWQTTFGGVSFDNGTGLDSTPQGDLVLAGLSWSLAPTMDAVVMRLDPGSPSESVCDLASPTSPNAWTSPLVIDAQSVRPLATTIGCAFRFERAPAHARQRRPDLPVDATTEIPQEPAPVRR